MSHSRGRDKAQPGKFAFECWDWSGNLFRAQGGFATAQEADRAAEAAEREMTMLAMGGGSPQISLDDAIAQLSDDELLAELTA